MSVLAKVGPEGQLKIPEELRLRLGIRPGDEVVLSPLEAALLVVPMPTQRELAASFTAAEPSGTPDVGQLPESAGAVLRARSRDVPRAASGEGSREVTTEASRETRREVPPVASQEGSHQVTARVPRKGSRTETLLFVCRLLLERGGPLDLGSVDIPVEFGGRGPSWDRPWRGLTYRLRSKAVADMTDEERAATSIYVTTANAPLAVRGGHLMATIDEERRRVARDLYRDPQRLQKALTEYIATGRKVDRAP